MCPIIIYANGTFRATVTQQNITIGTQIQVNFIIENLNVAQFTAPSFSDFSILSGPNKSSSFQIVNLTKTSSTTYSFLIIPNKTGTLIIDKATIIVDKKTLFTQPLTINVSKNASINTTIPKANTSNEKDVYIRANSSKLNVYVGEPFLIEYQLCTRIQVSDFVPLELPHLHGFWAEELLDKRQQGPQSKEMINGLEYVVVGLKKTILIAQKSGELQLDEMSARINVHVPNQNNDPFSFFFSQRNVIPKKLKNESITITVKPLPEPIPNNFNGSVGQFSLQHTIDKRQVKVGEPILLNIKISGSGNLKLIEPPKFFLQNNIQTFDPKIAENITITGHTYSGSKTFFYTIIPQKEGVINLNKVMIMSYFNPQKELYDTLFIPNFYSSVLPNQNLQNEFTSKSPLTLPKNRNKILAYSLILGTSVLFFGIWIFRKTKIIPETPQRLLAQKRLISAQKLINTPQKNDFYNEVVRSLWSYLCDKLSIPFSNLNKENITKILYNENIDNNQTQKLLNILTDCEFALFGKGEDLGNRQYIYEQAVQWIEQFEVPTKS